MKTIVAILLFVLMIGGCATKESSLLLSDAMDLFRENEIQLIEIDQIDPDYAFNKTLNGVKPTLFSVNDQQIVSIYVFSSHSDVDAGIEVFENKTATATLEMHERYVIDNLLVFYILREHPIDPANVTAIKKMQK